MIADVPRATVVITNPTHFAVALRYVAGETAAPEVLAKGVDTLALKIRQIAAANGMPVIENPPLARALHAGCDIGDLIPPAHYQAVAEIISYVLRLGERPLTRPAVPGCWPGRPAAHAPSFRSPRHRILGSTQRLGPATSRPSMEPEPCAGSFTPPAGLAAAGLAAGPARPRRRPVRHGRVPQRIRWTRCRSGSGVLARMAAEEPAIRACAQDAGPLPEPRHHGLARAAARARAARRRGQVRAVNRFVNRWPYRSGRRQLRPQRLLGDAARVLPPLGRLRGLRHRQVPLAAAARAAGRAAAPGRGAGRGARPAARGAGGLSGATRSTSWTT